MAQRNKNPYFGFTQVILREALAHDSEAHYIFDQMMSLSLLIRAGKGQIIKTKRFLNETRSHLAHLQFLKAYNLDMPVSNPEAFKAALRTSEKQAFEEIHMHQKDLKKIYIKHNELVNDLKKCVDRFVRTCAIRHTDPATTARDTGKLDSLPDVGDIEGIPQVKEEQTLVRFHLNRKSTLVLIKKLSEEIKAKPNCDHFTITIPDAKVTKE